MRAVPIQADDVERVLADINADDGNCADNLGHGALLVCCAGSQHTTGQVGARPDIPLADMRWRQLLFGLRSACGIKLTSRNVRPASRYRVEKEQRTASR